jgi:hypothetical protein
MAKARDFRHWRIHAGGAQGNAVRQVPDEAILRWRRLVRAGECSASEIGRREGWAGSTVRRYVYRSRENCRYLDDEEPPVKERPFVAGRVSPLTLDPDEVWDRRHELAWLDWDRELGVAPCSTARHMRGRGWRRQQVSVLTHAPCRRCGRGDRPVSDLSEDRVCTRCREGARAMEEESGVSHEELRREREAWERRRSGTDG